MLSGVGNGHHSGKGSPPRSQCFFAKLQKYPKVYAHSLQWTILNPTCRPLEKTMLYLKSPISCLSFHIQHIRPAKSPLKASARPLRLITHNQNQRPGIPPWALLICLYSAIPGESVTPVRGKYPRNQSNAPGQLHMVRSNHNGQKNHGCPALPMFPHISNIQPQPVPGHQDQ